MRKTTNENNMGNLFVVFMPFQLFVAQQIIHQEGLKDNVLLLGYRELRDFSQIYDMICIDDMWKKKIDFHDIAIWNGVHTHSFTDIRNCYANYKKIKQILEENNIKNIYLGEIKNDALRFTAVVFHHRGYKIKYFEEGSSHYLQQPSIKRKGVFIKAKELIQDYLYYLPIYHVKYAMFRYNYGLLTDHIPIDERYSIVPGYYHESFDKRLYVDKDLRSEQLNGYLQQFDFNNNSERILFLSESHDEGHRKDECFYAIIRKRFSKLPKGSLLYIKFHPRAHDDARKEIISIAESFGLHYIVVAKEVNIPVEYILMKWRFDKIILFNSSVYFYIGYIYDKTEIESLMPQLYEECKRQGVGNLTTMKATVSVMH